MNFFASLKHAEFAAKLFTSAGLNFATMFAGGKEDALKAHIEAAVAAAPAKPDAELTAKVGTLEAALTSATTTNTAITTALAGIGYKAEAITTESLKSHIKLHAAELLAQAGHAPLAETTSADVTKPAVKAATTREEHYAAAMALPEGRERSAYFAKHLKAKTA